MEERKTKENGIILYAEDDKHYREVVLLSLQARGIENPIEDFSDGDALEKRLNQGIEGVVALLTDNQMPGIKGSEIIDKYAFTLGIPMILYYGGDKRIGKNLSEKYNNVYSIQKPGMEEVVDTLREVINLTQLSQ